MVSGYCIYRRAGLRFYIFHTILGIGGQMWRCVFAVGGKRLIGETGFDRLTLKISSPLIQPSLSFILFLCFFPMMAYGFKTITTV